MKFIKKVPMAVSSLSLALAALGNLLLPYGKTIRYLCGVFSFLILCVFVVKLIFDTAHVKEELKNPVVFSIFPTSTMTLMLLLAYIRPYISFAVYIWYGTVILHIIIMVIFFKNFLAGFNLQFIFPSWFIACAGIAAASITSPAMGAAPIGQALFYLGFILYLIILPLVLYRMIKGKPIPEPARPTIAIFTAPVSLCLVGYLSAFKQPSISLVYLMFGIAVISYLYVSVNMISLLRLKFYPTYAAFTFPYVISAIAFKSANEFLTGDKYAYFSFAVKVSEWLAILVVVYVLIRYIMFFLSGPSQNQKSVSS